VIENRREKVRIFGFVIDFSEKDSRACSLKSFLKLLSLKITMPASNGQNVAF
jgi:hypothetical protein